MEEKTAQLYIIPRTEALNHVHSIAAKLWTEKVPVQNRQQLKVGRQEQQRRITPVQLPGRGSWNTKPAPDFAQRQFPQNKISLSQNHTTFKIDELPSKKRAQIRSLPLKPPDIKNFDLFPTVGSSAPQQQRTAVSFLDAQSKPFEANPFAVTAEECFDPKYERNKICTGVQKVQTQIKTSPTSSKNSGAAALKVLEPFPTPVSENQAKSVSTGETKRLTELTQFATEQVEDLKKLSSSYSDSLDANLCRSVLAELIFLFQMLVANNDEAVTCLESGQAARHLVSLAPRIFFVTQVFEQQLPLLSSISPDIIQMLIDFYPDRIPQSLQKKFELIIQKKAQEDTQRHLISASFSGSVIFQSEVDGKGNFPHQKDCQDFGKQRDLFYAVRDIWTSRQRGMLSPNPNPQSSSTYDPAYPKLKLLFTMNSSPTNLSRLASLFISQCVLDLNASNSNDSYDLGSVENVQRIFLSNPSKYEKLRQRLQVSDCFLDGNQPVPDPIDFLKYLITTVASPSFTQHLIDHTLHQIHKFDCEAGDVSPSEAVHLMRKTHLLAQILGFLYFLPYRDDEYKKPIGPINVEIYLQSQIALRIHHSFPLDLAALLVTAFTQRKLVFTLSWVIVLLSRADQVTFHLPAYKEVLSLISSIYRELLAVSPSRQYPIKFCSENKTILRFLCGKLFGLPGFPDVYLFGSNMKQLSQILPRTATVKLEEESVPLDMNNLLGLTFLPVWFRVEMKQIINVLSANATVRGSIPSHNPGIVKHIRAIPQHISRNTENESRKCNAENLQADLEAQFFQIHPAATKKTVDFISERIASNFLKQLRSKVLAEIKAELNFEGTFGRDAVLKCKEEISKKLDTFATERCKEAVNLLLGGFVSDPVRLMCQVICVRNAGNRVLDWMNRHVSLDLFPEVFVPSALPTQISKSSTEETPGSSSQSKGSLFQLLRGIHLSVQRLYKGQPIDGDFVDRILKDERLIKEKPWVSHRTMDLALAIIIFSPATLNEDRLMKFITFWKKIWTKDSFTFLCPRNLLLISHSFNLKATECKMSCLIRSLLKENLVTVTEIQESCMILLRENWPDSTNIWISELLKDILPDMPLTEEKEVVDWISWFLSGDGSEESQ